MDVNKRFLEIIKGADFRCKDAIDSADQLIKFGHHLLTQYEALGEERQQRGHELLSIILANELQPLALTRHGIASFDTIRCVLVEEFARSGANIKFQKYLELAKQAISNLGLNDYQVKQLNKLLDLMPDIVIELLTLHASRFILLPRERATTLALVLREIFQEEVDHDKLKRHN